MARKPAALAAPSTAKELKDLLWKSADKLRGSMDASQYKDVVLGLVFLKYVSDAFEERQEQIWDELMSEGYGEDAIAEAGERLGIRYRMGQWLPPKAFKDWNDCLLNRPMEPVILPHKEEREQNLSEQRNKGRKI